jgi:hypothetical protein
MGCNPGATAVTSPAKDFVPESSVVTCENYYGFVTVLRKKLVSPSPVNPSATVYTANKPRIHIIGVISSSSLSVMQKTVRRKSYEYFVSCLCLEVTTSDAGKYLKDQLQLASFTCTRLIAKYVYNSYASFHVSVVEYDFHLINNTGIWPDGCSIAPLLREIKS